ncbi:MULTISPECIES: hypothetical protein [unclassified Bradyrhizobium]|uniref:hypothetical protein n=1 Tax=unclassified Bradyrhizobium TaxID=2631580 RepID=UPI002FF32E32
MLSWLTAIPSLITGAFGTINNLTAAISNEKINARNAQTQEEKIAAEERIRTLEARRDLMIKEAGVSRANIFVRSALAVPVVIVFWKLLVWDKVVGSLAGCSAAPPGTCGIFTTDPLDDNQWKFIAAVTGFYFLYEAANIFRRK